MCGICGIFSDSMAARERAHVVEGMMRRLAHRGPDGRGIWAVRDITLGHQRLAIIDLQTGAQPMVDPTGRYAIVLNGEIYNYLELRSELERGGDVFRTTSDTEVLLKLLMREGADALARLNGMFAFAFVDSHTGEWLLARDAFGVKPLYIAEIGDGILFASEIKALFAHPGVARKLNWTGLQDYLTFQFCLGEDTLFEGIRRLDPGTLMRGTRARIDEQRRYWDFRFEIDESHDERYFTDRLGELLRDSARLQLRSDAPMGAYLSGGLDSSAVVSLARAEHGGPLPLFHGRFAEGPQYDESEYASSVAESTGCPIRVVTPTASDFVEDLPKLIRAMDEPVAGPGLFPQFCVSRLAAKEVKVVLGGQGGDEMYGGYARYLIAYLEQALKGAIFETQEEQRHIVTLRSVIENLPVLKNYRPLMQHFWRDGLFDPMDARYFRLIDRSPDLFAVLSDDAAARFDRAGVFARFQSIFNHPDTHSYFNKMTHFDLKTLLPALLQVEDRVSMAVSIESRVPLLDTRIADLVGSIPPRLKFAGGSGKSLLKKALGGLLPASVRDRKDKMGFPVPLSEWLAGGVVRDFVVDVLTSRRCRERGLFRDDVLYRLLDGEAIHGREVWGMLCLELWHQTFLDGHV